MPALGRLSKSITFHLLPCSAWVPQTLCHVAHESFLGLRRPPGHYSREPIYFDGETECEAGRICVGPRNDHYSIGHAPGSLLTSRFVVPPLPKSYDSEKMTYYDYFNIFFRQQPEGGYFNQFVPQLMLGNVLANSTNWPNYTPIWEILDEWHIGAQYFFALLCENTQDPCWNAYAATGRLIKVVPGEVVETSFELVEVNHDGVIEWEWQLRMGVVGAHPTRWSLVAVPTPYMGLLPKTKWQDDNYINITVGSCFENYGMTQADNFPYTWEIAMDIIITHGDAPIWGDWIETGGQKCSWMPRSTIRAVEGYTWQRATWNATILEGDSGKGASGLMQHSSAG